MTESEIKICGHGSGMPTEKVMKTYLSSRHSQKASNGLDKGLVCVVRFLETEIQRQKFHDLYETLIGRNYYSQSKRQYVYSPDKEGRYYSDCSSSICYTYDKCGIQGVKNFNTAEMFRSGKKVDVNIIDGHVAESDLGKLLVGDALLFRGNDPSRPMQIGHVEAVYSIPADTCWVKLADGHWMYRENGKYLASSWRVINGHWYHFNDKAIMDTGWARIDGDWYYLEESGDFEGACWRSDSSGRQFRWNV